MKEKKRPETSEAALEQRTEKPLAVPKKKKRPMSKNKKKLLIAIISVALVLAILAGVLIVRGVIKRRPPKLEDVRARLEQVITDSAAVNDMFWGEGLAVFPRIYEEVVPYKVQVAYRDKGEMTVYTNYRYTNETDGSVILRYRYWVTVTEDGGGITYYDVEKKTVMEGKPASPNDFRYVQRYTEKKGDDFIHCDTEKGYYYYRLEAFDPNKIFIYSAADQEHYDYVRTDTGYLSTDDMKVAAEKVYSKDYLNSLYESMFTGVTTGSAILYARYYDYEDNENGTVSLVKYNGDKGYDLTEWVYDFSTMKMVEESNSTFLTIEVERTDAKDAARRETAKLYFALENGEWYLDSPSF